MAICAIDFDGTLVNGATVLPGAANMVKLLKEKGHKIIIHSLNGKVWIERVLNEAGIPFDLIWTQEHGRKPNADIFIDDKGYHHFNNSEWSPEETDHLIRRLSSYDNRRW